MSDELERRVDEAIRNDGILSVAQGLREYYEADNRIGVVLDRLIEDLRSGSLSAETRAEAEASLTEIDPESTAHVVIRRALAEQGN